MHVTLASQSGGQPPLDPKSSEPDFQTDATHRFDDDQAAQNELACTAKLSEMKVEDFDAVFYPGGHGPLWDLHNDSDSIALIEGFIAAGKPIAAVCHAPAVLLKAKDQNGDPLVKGKRLLVLVTLKKRQLIDGCRAVFTRRSAYQNGRRVPES